MKKYISVAQTAKKLGVSVETVYSYCKKGVLGGRYIKVGKRGSWKVDVESIELLLDGFSTL